MYNSNQILGLACCVLLGSSFVLVNSISIIPSKLIVSYQDPEIRFDCTGGNYDAETEVIFNIADRMVFNSSSGYLGYGVKKISETAITTRQLTKFADVNCQINGTSSDNVTIPYVAWPTFAALPNKFKVGQKFIANCGAQVKPMGKTAFNVSFTKDSTVFALYSIEYNRAKWRIVPVPAEIEATVGTITSTSTTVNVNPKTKNAAGKYGCIVSVPNEQSGLSWTVSPMLVELDTSGSTSGSSFGLTPSFVLIGTLITSLVLGFKVY